MVVNSLREEGGDVLFLGSSGLCGDYVAWDNYCIKGLGDCGLNAQYGYCAFGYCPSHTLRWTISVELK